MKKKTRNIAIALVTVISVGLLGACGHWHKTPEEKAEYAVSKITRKLDLNDTQVTRLDRLKSEILSAGRAFREGHEKSHDDLLALLEAPALDQPKLVSMIMSGTTMVDNRAPAVIAALGEFYDSLDAQQQGQVREHLKDHIEHRRGHWH